VEAEENPGAAEDPDVFPNSVPAAAFDNANERAGVVVAVATEAVNSGLRLPELNEVTVPDPAPVAVKTPPAKFSPVLTVTGLKPPEPLP
jgi:hypothetical protein